MKLIFAILIVFAAGAALGLALALSLLEAVSFSVVALSFAALLIIMALSLRNLWRGPKMTEPGTVAWERARAERAEAEAERLRAALETIEAITDDEIGVRFRMSNHKSEEEMAGKSTIYHLLSIPRNMARAALKAEFMSIIFGECDYCTAKNRMLHKGEVTGIETYACAECYGRELADDVDDLQDEIERLRPLAETGEQWARICAIEAALVEAGCKNKQRVVRPDLACLICNAETGEACR